jgi:hypothetical protein
MDLVDEARGGIPVPALCPQKGTTMTIKRGLHCAVLGALYIYQLCCLLPGRG